MCDKLNVSVLFLIHICINVLCNIILQIVTETLSVGAPLLLPPLRERMELLHSLLPQGQDRWESLSQGQVRHLVELYQIISYQCNIKNIEFECFITN